MLPDLDHIGEYIEVRCRWASLVIPGYIACRDKWQGKKVYLCLSNTPFSTTVHIWEEARVWNTENQP